MRAVAGAGFGVEFSGGATLGTMGTLALAGF